MNVSAMAPPPPKNELKKRVTFEEDGKEGEGEGEEIVEVPITPKPEAPTVTLDEDGDDAANAEKKVCLVGAIKVDDEAGENGREMNDAVKSDKRTTSDTFNEKGSGAGINT